MKYKIKRPTCLLWPFAAIWRLIDFGLNMTKRLIAIVLGFILIMAGVAISFTIIGLIIGIPLILFCFLLLIKGIY